MESGTVSRYIWMVTYRFGIIELYMYVGVIITSWECKPQLSVHVANSLYPILVCFG